jgi:hypothetical protein
LHYRIGIIEKGSEEIREGNWIPDQGEGFGGGTAHGHVGVGSQGLAQSRNGCGTNGTETLGKGEPHQAAWIAEPRHHLLDQLLVPGGAISAAQLLLQLRSQKGSFLFTEGNGRRYWR